VVIPAFIQKTSRCHSNMHVCIPKRKEYLPKQRKLTTASESINDTNGENSDRASGTNSVNDDNYDNDGISDSDSSGDCSFADDASNDDHDEDEGEGDADDYGQSLEVEDLYYNPKSQK
jgi:hypothetical protein